ncbi:MAG: N-acetylmuramoyl-L-alanine amidase [Phycisphaerales bacterium]|jgi:N-acetylmuramoyl-L-alanine amidase|nr:N-acetylmuramoyl-L-alanine amidase [Phycisphaerales bacterium]
MNTDGHGWKNGKLLYLCVSVFICGSILIGCSPKRPPVDKPIVVEAAEPMPLAQAMTLIDEREEWTKHPTINVPRHPAEKFLKDLTIVIDPGHGGEDGGASSTQPKGYKAGRRGEKEAFMNLRVGLLLDRLLKDAGCDVVMTRHGDDTIGLRARSEVANNVKRRRDGVVGADLFVSIHHNAGGGSSSNFTSVFYHGSVDDNEPDIDVARYLALELGRAMRTQVAKTSPILSSQLMYPGGFGVLRYINMPGVLLECSFFTVAEEEQRLRDAGYNLREAYAIYVGLCEWAYCGRPTQTPPAVASSGDKVTLTTTLDEGLPSWWGSDRSRILKSTVNVTLDGRTLPVEFDELSRKVTATLPTAALTGEHDIVIHHENFLKNSNWPQRYALDDGKVRPLPSRRPSRQPPRRVTTKPATTTASK